MLLRVFARAYLLMQGQTAQYDHLRVPCAQHAPPAAELEQAGGGIARYQGHEGCEGIGMLHFVCRWTAVDIYLRGVTTEHQQMARHCLVLS
jgi:hypothetical protein